MKYRFLCMVGAALATSLIMAASAMAFGEIRYADRALNLRDARSPKAEWIGMLHTGQKVRIGFEEHGWVAIFEPSETRADERYAVGFSNVKYLKSAPVPPEPNDWGRRVVAPANLNLRATPSVHGEKLDVLPAGREILLDFPSDDWAMAFASTATVRSKLNRIGFVSLTVFPEPDEGITGSGQVSSTVTPPKPIPAVKPVPAPVVKPAPKAKATPRPESKPWGKVVTVQRKINIRSDRTTGSRWVRTLKPGEKVKVGFLESGWYAVFLANEPVRDEARAMGYVLQALIEGGPENPVAGQKPAAPKPEPVKPKPAPVIVPAKRASSSSQQSIVLDRSKIVNPKRPDPAPNKTAHGFRYRLLEKAQLKKLGENWIVLKIFLATDTLPSSDNLQDFARTLWREHKRSGKHLEVLVYLPGMDTGDLAWGVSRFDDEKPLEQWVRKTTLFGTQFLQ